MTKGPKAKRKALAKFDEREGEFQRNWRRAIANLKLDPAQTDFLRLVTVAANVVGYLPWSNRIIRRAAAAALIDLLLRGFSKHPARRRWLGTFCWDAGITWERRPHVDLVAMKLAVWKALDGYGLTGIGVIEVDVLKQRRGEKGCRLLFHIHVIVEERRGSKFRPRKAAFKLRSSRRFRNRLGAPSVQFKRITATAADIAWVAAYITKLPPCAKNMVPHRKRPGRHVVRDCEMAPAWALRLLEIMSHMQATDAVFGIGRKGRRQRRAWHERFRRRLRRRRGRREHFDGGDDVAREWPRIRSRNGSKRLEPCRIITKARHRK
ncbi:MAG: hypothetical protein QOH47_2498 [Sphingomonadales bacterium]|jgi:hypothetical protein|nr:hypothetical protein [Sphingomonadales bacterium]